MNSDNIKKVIIWALVAILVLILAGWIVWQIFFAAPSFHAVSLVTGEVYFGELQRFPTFGLKNVYTMNVNPENEEQPVSIQKFDNVFWGPENFLEINRDNVAWMVELKKDGQLSQLLENNPNLVPQQGGQAPGTVPSAGSGIPGPSGSTGGGAQIPSGN